MYTILNIFCLYYIKIANLLSANGFHDFCYNLKQYSQIQSLNFSDNRISRDGLMSLVQYYSRLPELSQLDISSNYIGDGSIMVFANFLFRFTNLTYLNLSDNMMSNKSFISLSNHFSYITDLVFLDISNSLITSGCCKEFEDNSIFIPYIKTFKCSKNKFGFKDCCLLIDSFSQTTNLNTLSMSNTEMKSDGIKYLSDHLMNISLIQNLDISSIIIFILFLIFIKIDNEISSEELTYFSLRISILKDLENIDLSKGMIGSYGLHTFTDCISALSNLKSLI